MRASAYRKAIDQVATLPIDIPAYTEYFNDRLNPRLSMMFELRRKIQLDELLHHSEIMELFKYSFEKERQV